MKKVAKSAQAKNDEMRPEYDFRGAERGKHYEPLHEGYTVQIHQPDGTTVVEHYKLEEGTVMSQMPDAKAVAQRTRRTGGKKGLTRNQPNPVKT